MGQYHILCNLTKKEFLDPHQMGYGLKLREQVGFPAPMSEVLWPLIACSQGRGGGDFPLEWDPAFQPAKTEKSEHSDYTWVSEWNIDEERRVLGRWAGDRIAIVGDYSEPGDIKGVRADRIYDWCNNADENEEMLLPDYAERHYRYYQKRRKPNGTYEYGTYVNNTWKRAPKPRTKPLPTGGWKNITRLVIPVYEKVAGVKIDLDSDGWRERTFDPEEWSYYLKPEILGGERSSQNLAPDLVITTAPAAPETPEE